MTTFAARLAEERPDEVALRDDDTALSWADVEARLDPIVDALLAADLGTERRVAVFAENSVMGAIAYLGALLAGASAVPVNSHLTAAEVVHILRESGSRLMLVGRETAARGATAAQQAGLDLVVGWDSEAIHCVTPLPYWVGAAPAHPRREGIVPRPPLIYTSGTTGRPKGTELPPTSFPYADTVEGHLAAVRASTLAQHAPHLVAGPMYHTGPLAGTRLLGVGCPLVILRRFDALAALTAIEAHHVASTVMVPTHLIRLLALPPEVRGRFDVSSLQYVLHTGAKCPVEVKRAMIDWWGPVLHEVYGATEVGATCTISSSEWLEHPGSVGRAVAPFEALVVDDDGRPVADGHEGRLFFRDATGRGVVYRGNREAAAAAHLAPGVFTLGEIGYVEPDGFVYITDRASDMVISGGVNIAPAETEEVLLQHHDVLDAACIGVPHPEMGEELRALVVPADPLVPPDPAELMAYTRARLASHKCPCSVIFVDSLPRTALGKLNKRELRAAYSPVA